MGRAAAHRRNGLCLVRGSGDVGSAVAHALFRAGFAVAIHDVPAPAYPRRGMAFVDALFDGHALLAGVPARLAADADTLLAIARRRRAIPVFAGPLDLLLEQTGPRVLVDARMRKRETPEAQVGLAALTLGLGPNFRAGETTDWVVETAWGDELGALITRGASRPLEGEPRMIVGHSRARFVYAPCAGRVESAGAIGMRVSRGDAIARVNGTVVRAPLDGIVAGLTRHGVAVREGAKIVEVDPRGDPQLAFGIGERPRTIAAGVLRAIERHCSEACAAPARAASLSRARAIRPEPGTRIRGIAASAAMSHRGGEP